MHFFTDGEFAMKKLKLVTSKDVGDKFRDSWDPARSIPKLPKKDTKRL